MKTVIPSGVNIPRNWHVIDAENVVLGRLASKAANILMGKHKPSYTPYIDMGDHIVVINADKVRLTGKKEEQKMYRSHSGYPGGLREEKARMVRAARPARIVEDAISGMLPKNKLGKQMYRKLNVYAGAKHPHDAQKPIALARECSRSSCAGHMPHTPRPATSPRSRRCRPQRPRPARSR